MSKRSERKQRAEERKKEARRKLVRGAIIVIVFALSMLVLGVVGFISNRDKYAEYEASEDVRKVDAVVTSVETKSRKDEYGTKYYYYKAKVTYTVDGTEYNGVDEFDKQVKVGETVRVEVYKAKNGTFKIPEITNKTANQLYNILYIAVAVFGFVLVVISIVVLIPKKEK